MRARTVGAVVLLGWAACSGGASRTQPVSTPVPASGTELPQRAGETVPGQPAALPAVHVLTDVADRRARLVVQNHDTSTVQLARQVAVERAQGAGFAAFEQQGLALRGSCQDGATGCVALAAGGELRPPAWDTHKAAVACDEGTGPTAAIGPSAVPAGRYRFVLHTCDGAGAVPSEPFEVR